MKKKIIPTLLLLVAGAVTNTYAQKISPLPVSDQEPLQPVLEQIKKLVPVDYIYDQQTAQLLQLPKGWQTGFINEDAGKVFPELLVKHDALIQIGKGTMKSVRYETVDMSKLIPILVKAIQEQQKQIDELKHAAVSEPVQPIPQNFKGSYMEAEGCIFFDPLEND